MPQIYDMGPTALAGFEPADLGTKDQHATHRPPKPSYIYIYRRHALLYFVLQEMTLKIFKYSLWVSQQRFTSTH